MFGPKHTIESVTKELVDGLEEGTTILHPEELTEADVENFASMMKVTLARSRRREAALLAIGTLSAIVSIVIVLVQVVFYPESQPYLSHTHISLTTILLGFILGAVMGYVLGFKARERSVELKIYIRILKMADAITARKLVLREGPRLRERELVP
jgi:hypothetical protein